MATRTVCRAFHTTRPRREPKEFRIRTYVSPNFRAKDLKRRLAAAEQLDKTIDPNDLSKTLEDHRAVNRGSIISYQTTKQSDTETDRPAFLDKEVPVAATYRRLRLATGDLSARWSEEHIKNLEESQKNATWKDRAADQYRTNMSLHKERIKYLRKYEEPLDLIPSSDDRLAQFEVLRRFAVVLHKHQNKTRTMGKVLKMEKRMMEYEGTYVPMKPIATKGPEPWARRPKYPYTGHQRLEHEMMLFEDWMTLTQEEMAAREVVHKRVLEVIEKNAPGYSVEMFGSQTTGLALPTSDIDLRIFPTSEAEEPPIDIAAAMSPTEQDLATPDPVEEPPQTFSKALKTRSYPTKPPNPADQDQILKTMLHLQKTLMNDAEFSSVVIHPRRFPLVGATHTPSGLSIQLISSNIPTLPARQAIQEYLSQYPKTLKPIYTIVKTSLDLRGLSNVWTGGLGSYAIFMMVVAALKHHCKPGDSMAKQLIGVLEFWSGFNTRNGISIEPPLVFQKKVDPSLEEKRLRETDPVLAGRLRIAQPRYYHAYNLCLQDPADPLNDLGKKSYAIKDIKVTFGDIHAGLFKDIQAPNNHSQTKPLLRRLVGRCDRLYDDYRTKVELYGDKFVEHDGETEEAEENEETEGAEENETKEAEENEGAPWLS